MADQFVCGAITMRPTGTIFETIAMRCRRAWIECRKLTHGSVCMVNGASAVIQIGTYDDRHTIGHYVWVHRERNLLFYDGVNWRAVMEAVARHGHFAIPPVDFCTYALYHHDQTSTWIRPAVNRLH